MISVGETNDFALSYDKTKKVNLYLLFARALYFVINM